MEAGNPASIFIARRYGGAQPRKRDRDRHRAVRSGRAHGRAFVSHGGPVFRGAGSNRIGPRMCSKNPSPDNRKTTTVSMRKIALIGVQ
jgi:hypothetical protein